MRRDSPEDQDRLPKFSTIFHVRCELVSILYLSVILGSCINVENVEMEYSKH